MIKACSAEILHKTEKGLVRLNLASEAEVAAAFTDIQKAAERSPGDRVPHGEGSRELVGNDAPRGHRPCVMFGLGGVYTELLRDIALSRRADHDDRRARDDARDTLEPDTRRIPRHACSRQCSRARSP